MKKETLAFVVVALIVGILLGVLFSRVGDKGPSSTSGTVSAAPAPAVNYQEFIQTLEQIVAREPENRNAWVQLGHNYFDSNRPMEAIEAYSKALELNGNDPDVLVDQGIMFRRVGWFDKAVENFNRALDINPRHQQALFNLGVVYRYDLQDYDTARETWSRYLEINPSGPGSEQIRAEMSFLEAHPTPPAGAPAQ
jgi:cytochrome c-type biogenesis protein CcmH/NrfG